MAINKNTINRRLHLFCRGDIDKVEEIKSMIEQTLYADHHKKWKRILNNNSQPSLEEAAFIASKLDTSIESLFEFSFQPGN